MENFRLPVDQCVSTDLSSDNEYQYLPPAKQLKPNENLLGNEMQDFEDSWDAPDGDNIKTETVNHQDSGATQDFGENSINEKKLTTPQKNIENEDCQATFLKNLKKRDLNERLIHEIRKYDCIYNLESPQYKDFEHKKHLWHKIGKRIGLRADDARVKWKNIKDSYRKHKLKSLNKSGFRKPYKYSNSLKFLDDINAYRSNRTYIPLSDDAEVSTDLSSDNEYQYPPPEKQMKPNDENLLDNERQDFFEDSWDAPDGDNVKTETVNHQDNGATQDVGENSINEENLTTPQKNIENEDCQVTFLENLQKRDLNERLIHEIKKYNCIYNLESPQYKDFEHKKHLWHKIGKRIGLRADDARVKWRNIKDSYRKYKLKSLNERGFRKPYKYSNSLKFLDDINAYRPFHIKKNNYFSEQEVSTDLSSDEDTLQITTTTNRTQFNIEKLQESDANNITVDLFKVLVNKIDEANLNAKERNDIEFAVSTAVYSKLAEYNKSKTK